MSRTDDTTADRRAQVSKANRDNLNMLRRMVVRVTSKPFWQAVGVLLLDGATRETVAAEVFSNIGFYSRPKSGANAEAVVANLGGAAENGVIIATRDEDTRKRVAQLDQDETMAYNTLAGVKMTKAGKIFACAHGGTPVELALASELNNLRAFVMQQFSAPGHTHGVSGAVTNSVVPVVAPVAAPATAYPGTDVLKGQ